MSVAIASRNASTSSVEKSEDISYIEGVERGNNGLNVEDASWLASFPES